MGTQSSGDDEVTSLMRRSHISAGYDHDLRFDNRNSEDVHKDALAKALAEHERVRIIALRAYQLNEAREAQERLRLHTLQEEERVRILTQRAEEECRLRDIQNKARQIPKPAPLIPNPPTPPPVKKPKPPSPPVQQSPPQQTTPPAPAQQQPGDQHQTQHPKAPSPSIPQPNPFRNLEPPSQPPAPSQVTKFPQPQQPVAPPVQAPQPKRMTATSHLLPGTERYVVIHQNLKNFRKRFKQAQESDKSFRTKSNDMRRALRMQLGQLTVGVSNKPQVDKTASILLESLNQVQSELVDPSGFVLSIPEPQPGVVNNVDQLPSLFIWLLNHFSKSVVGQLASECAKDTKAAEPIGLIVAHTFSNSAFHWRGKPLIDILMAKMWKVCPVLFGARGNEATELGRAALGWARFQNGKWMGDMDHTDRMTGVSAGYAAMSLRNFGNGSRSGTNPWPPYHYWQTMASIVSTPPEEISATHCTVLKAMIEHFEGHFLRLYGDAARAALQIALVNFPNKVPDRTELRVAVTSLKVLADQLERDYGLVLKG